MKFKNLSFRHIENGAENGTGWFSLFRMALDLDLIFCSQVITLDDVIVVLYEVYPHKVTLRYTLFVCNLTSLACSMCHWNFKLSDNSDNEVPFLAHLYNRQLFQFWPPILILN